MKVQLRKRNRLGMTLIEVLVVLFVILILAVLLLPAVVRSRLPASRISCVNNVKQVALAFRLWSNDNGEKFPWAVASTSTNQGTMEFLESGHTWRHFQITSNELSSPKVLKCPSDERKAVFTWEELTNNKHLSYFAGLDADETRPQTILSGDRNLKSTVKPTNGILRLTAFTPAEWTDTIHVQQGNIALGDGSAQQLTTNGLRRQIESALSTDTNRPVIRLALPE